MEFFMIGSYKEKGKITGFRLLGYSDGSEVEVKDVNYTAVFQAISANKIKISNLQVKSGCLLGVNGAISRYGEVGKTRSLVVLREITDDNGVTQGYVCADTSGKVKNMRVNEVIDFSEKFGIANGRIMTSEKGVKTVATIEGHYSKISISQMKQNNTTPNTGASSNTLTAENTEQVKSSEKPQTTNTNSAQSQPNAREFLRESAAQADKKSADLYSNALLMDNNLKQHADYSKTFASKVATTVRKQRKCSEKQYLIIWKELNNVDPKAAEYFKITPTDLYDESQKLIQEAKTFKEYKGSLVESIANTIAKMKKCSEKQYKAMKAKVDEWKRNNISTPTITNSSSSVSKSNEPLTQHESKPEQTVEQVKHPIHYDMTDIRNFEFKMIGDEGKKKLYIMGFKQGVSVENLVLPETLEVNGKAVPIQGIYNGAFNGNRDIRYVETGRYIEDIGQSAFQGCEDLETVDLSKSQHSFLAKSIFAFCKNLSSIEMGNRIARIHEGAFYGCKSLTEISLPNSLRDIARESFMKCTSLTKIIGGEELNIQEKAFNNCYRLDSVDFSTIQGIGSSAFKDTAFTELRIPGHIKQLGRKAFADCVRLKEVWIEDGVSYIGDLCFAKEKNETIQKSRRWQDSEVYTNIEMVHTTKSITKFGDNVFKGVASVEGYTGSATESHCRGYQVPFVAVDNINRVNSADVRFKSRIFAGNVNPLENLYKKLTTYVDGASNPEFEIHSKGAKGNIVNIPLSDKHLETLNIAKATQQVEPHIKFKAALNYLLDVSELYKAPFHTDVVRLQDTFYVKQQPIYDDGCNKISKVSYTIMDTLEKGEFILVLMNNSLVYCADCNEKTNIKMSEDNVFNAQLPFKEYLHAGDAIGVVSTICGQEATIEVEVEGRTRMVRVGVEVLKAIVTHSIQVELTQENRVYYVPACELAFRIVDTRKWERYGTGRVLQKGSIDQVIIQDIWDYNTFVKYMQDKGNKSTNENIRFFNNILKLDRAEVASRIRSINLVEEEKEAQLFGVSKRLLQIAVSNGIGDDEITPELVTYDLFKGIADSYWMIEKDEKWFDSIGKKSLNVTNQYMIEKYKLIEYRSNQVVKFSNPYMSGMKGAYIYRLVIGNSTIGIYASRFDFKTIVKMLIELTSIPNDISAKGIPVLMQKADEIDCVDRELFCDFYDVLDCKDGWSLGKKFRNSCFLNTWARFKISMYKPTGIFYLVMQRFVRKEVTVTEEGENVTKKVDMKFMDMPIVPIGNMDRALVVAGTTNTGAKDSNALKELITLCAYEVAKEYNVGIRSETDPTAYYKVRELLIKGESEANKYKELIDDRIVYMLGTIHKGVLKVEGDNIRDSISVQSVDELLEDADDEPIDYEEFEESEQQSLDEPDFEEYDEELYGDEELYDEDDDGEDY